MTLSQTARSLIYLSPHETQGIALEQMMSANVPVMAWDPGGGWQSLEYLLRGVRYGPVTTVPYWDERCGEKFTSAVDFGDAFSRFWHGVETESFAPRQMILDKGLTLEASAQAYAALADKYTYPWTAELPASQSRVSAGSRPIVPGSPGSSRLTSLAGSTRRAASARAR